MKKSNIIKYTVLALTMPLLSACSENGTPAIIQTDITVSTVQITAPVTTAPSVTTAEETTTAVTEPEPAVKTSDKATCLIKHWLVDHPLGVDVDVTELDSNE